MSLIFATLSATASVILAAAALVNEAGRRVGGITFYRIGRWRFSICRARQNKGA